MTRLGIPRGAVRQRRPVQTLHMFVSRLKNHAGPFTRDRGPILALSR